MQDTGRTVWRVGKHNSGTHGTDIVKGCADAVESTIAGLYHRSCARKHLELSKRDLATRGHLENCTR